MRKTVAAALTVVALAAAGCSAGHGKAPDNYNDDPKVLNVVMGSEQHLVFNEIVRPWCEKNGLTCNAKELGSVDPKEEPVKGTFAHHVKNVERIMWDKRFRQYRDWKVKWYNEYCKRGSFKAKTGFVYEGFMKKNEVLSYAIQGTAFHWMLWSLVQIHRWLRKNNMKTRLIGQIHDSIEADIHPKEKDDFIEKCHQVMTQDIHKHWDWIIVPLEVEAEISPIGGSWAEVAKQE